MENDIDINGENNVLIWEMSNIMLASGSYLNPPTYSHYW